MARFFGAALSVIAVALIGAVGIRTLREAHAFECVECDATQESFCATYGAGLLWCGQPESLSASATGTGHFIAETQIKWCETDIPELGWFEIDSSNNVNTDPEVTTIFPDIFFPETVGTHCGVLDVTIDGYLADEFSDGWMDNLAAVWTPYHEDIQRLNIDTYYD